MKYVILMILSCFASSAANEIPNFYLGGGNEISLAINPNNPNNVVVGANLKQLWYTTNSGESWTSSAISSKYGVWGDPALEFDADGNVYYAHLSNSEFWLDRIVVQKSTNGGESWTTDKGVGFNEVTQHDKEWIVADMTPLSPHYGDLYAAWTEFDLYGSDNTEDSTRILFSRSATSGDFWSDPIVVSDSSGNCIDDDETVEGAVPCTGPDGEIYISWAGPLGIMFDKSIDGGYSFGKDIFVTEHIGGWAYDIPNYQRCNGLPVTACDISSSPYKGRIYILYSAQNIETNTDVFMIKSDDKGKTWSESIDITGVVGDSHQFMSWMDVDPKTGYIYAAYYDNRNYPDNSQSDIYMAISKDGGATFENIKLNQYPIVPHKDIFLGDYLGIDAYDGNVWVAWTYRGSNTNASAIAAYYSDKDISVNENIFDNSLKLSPNPAYSISNLEFTLEEQSFVRLYIENLQGIIVDTPIQEEMAKGNHQFIYDISKLSSGVYFYRLDVGHKTIRKRCCIVR